MPMPSGVASSCECGRQSSIRVSNMGRVGVARVQQAAGDKLLDARAAAGGGFVTVLLEEQRGFHKARDFVLGCSELVRCERRGNTACTDAAAEEAQHGALEHATVLEQQLARALVHRAAQHGARFLHVSRGHDQERLALPSVTCPLDNNDTATSVSMPARPARPAICLYDALLRKSMAMYGLQMMTRRAGRLTPAASVDVQQRQQSVPLEYAPGER